MSVKSNGREDRVKLITLHTPEGFPIGLRQDFIMAVMGPGGSRGDHTKIYLDERNKTGIYEIKESMDQIPGRYADLGWLKINPDYFAGIVKNEDEDASDNDYRIRLQTPDNIGFITGEDKPKEVLAEIERAFALSP